MALIRRSLPVHHLLSSSRRTIQAMRGSMGAGNSRLSAEELCNMNITQCVSGLTSGRVTSVELTTALLQRAHDLRNLNAFIGLDKHRALAAAATADQEIAAGKSRGILHGVPLAIKDNIHVAGVPNTAGTPALRGFVPHAHAPVVQRLVDAGAIVLGKTNMHELAFGICSYNEGFHEPGSVGVRNAYSPLHSAGGSSGGTGAAVGARMAPGGLGTDTGASVRLPSAFNGIVGLRPTVTRYSGEGITPLSSTRDTAGPMARTVADVALLDAVIAGDMIKGDNKAPLKKLPNVPLNAIRLGIDRSHFLSDMDADTAAVTEAALQKLKAQGVVLVDVSKTDIDAILSANALTGGPVIFGESFIDLEAYLAKYVPSLTIHQVVDQIASRDVKDIYTSFVIPKLLPGNIPLEAPLNDALSTHRTALQKAYQTLFDKYSINALVFPCTPSVPPIQGPSATALDFLFSTIRNTDPGSNAGIPGLVVPAGLGPSSRLPVALELDGPAGSDRQLLAIGVAIEEVLGPLPPPPSMQKGSR